MFTTESFSITNLAVSERLSEETLCFTANICVNGKAVFGADNRGCGGETNIYPLPKVVGAEGLLKDAIAWAKTLPNEPCGHIEAGLPMTFDFLIDMLVGKSHEERQWKKKITALCKKYLVFRVPTDPDGEYRTLKSPYSAGGKAFVLGKYPNAEIINETLAA